MPKFEVKQIYAELDQGRVRGLYWLHGEERMKARELYRRVLRCLHHANSPSPKNGSEFNEGGLRSEAVEQITFEAGVQGDASALLDEYHALSLLSTVRLIRLRDAHLIKHPELIIQAIQHEHREAKEVQGVIVAFAKDLDARKKSSKLLLERAAVIACEAVPEQDREAWISLLAKRKGLEFSPRLVAQLRLLEPWSLDIVEQEIEKMLIAKSLSPDGGGSARKVLDLEDVSLGGVLAGSAGTEAFLEAFFSRQLSQALLRLEPLINDVQEALPLLGLLSWNVRQLLVLKQNQQASGAGRLNSFVAQRLHRWRAHWSVEDLIDLSHELYELDWQTKQVSTWIPGAWSLCVQRFCTHAND